MSLHPECIPTFQCTARGLAMKPWMLFLICLITPPAYAPPTGLFELGPPPTPKCECQCEKNKPFLHCTWEE